MELDLDSFLNSHVSLSDDDDDDDHLSSVPHRTIDEILNDTDSSASASPPSSTIHRLNSDTKPPEPPKYAVLVPVVKPEDERAVRTRPYLYSPVKSGDLADDPAGRVSKPSPWFLGGMRTNAKPGAALAAAAAASRLMPTPHATSIKSRRSAGSGVIQKVLESSEPDDNSEVSSNSNGDTNAIRSEVIRTNSKELQVDFGGELLRNGGVLKSENELKQASQVDETSAGNAVEEEKNVSSSYENLTNLDANDVKDTEFSKNVEVVEECKQEIQDLDDNSPCSKESDTEDYEGCGDGKDYEGCGERH
ncbi:vacuolar protein sorting-associated protein 8-like protein [Pyrus ussuriensis x Pyrus communis]|uniref:Vacuolar protein sorting-associated protein 8-like protein n=1 Tax=Pyrus ussuriensis x Pyrus communis TaxID=2448454 RepID=A0A5N5F4A7_9ROSA|nr:uncharacterized protein LOC125469141 [Pyrus x bretschneideri]XP_048422138.1 uncharacterized protein LOC125469141 [Pyrus x bretschneideri]KAB2597908.1 vacuolar protein sorting-associated protein 8-like protein [Pyrus ussuriensis x Pyrus communis]